MRFLVSPKILRVNSWIDLSAYHHTSTTRWPSSDQDCSTFPGQSDGSLGTIVVTHVHCENKVRWSARTFRQE